MKKSSVRISHLPSGIRVISDSMPHVRSVAVGIWIRCGSAYETAETNGISHFMEHMLFKGTRKRNAREIAQSLESVGGHLNASTGKELSIYTAVALGEYLPLSVDVLSDLITQPRFARREIELEKNVILSEINHAREDPEEMAIDYLYQNIFYNHSLGYFIYGTPENVIRFSRQDLRRHLQHLYTNDRIVFAAAGQVQHATFVDLVQRAFPGMPAVSSQPAEFPPPQQSRLHFQLQQPSLQQAHISLGARTFGYNDERKYALVLLEMLLGSGMSSRLFQNIREKYGFAYSVYSFIDLMSSVGVLGCYMGCDAQKVDQSMELLGKELKKLSKQSIRTEELERVKSQARGNILLGLESSGRRMHRIAETEIQQGKHLSITELVHRVEKVTPGDLTELAREFLNEDKMIRVNISPLLYS
ncbi:insulinase family protein [candidate division KSB1 bacterium]|nr:insulinase family protein [candidate division KSB1 bacterium]